MDLSISFLLFFGGLSSICALLLYKSIMISRRSSTHHTFQYDYPVLYSWYTPNLKKWKQFIYEILYWARDISFSYWTVWLISKVKYTMYRLLRSIHKYLLGTIKFLERHEDQLKERLSEQGNQPRSATEQRLIRTLSQKRYPNNPANAPQ